MSCLLDQLFGPSAERPDGTLRYLLLDAEVRAFIQESNEDEDVAIGSCPGRMPRDGWLRSLTSDWIVTAPSPLDDRALTAVSVAPRTGRTLLLSWWPRAALTQHALGQALDAQLRMHRLWQSRLLPAPEFMPTT